MWYHTDATGGQSNPKKIHQTFEKFHGDTNFGGVTVTCHAM
jgi:hypothetical protein